VAPPAYRFSAVDLRRLNTSSSDSLASWWRAGWGSAPSAAPSSLATPSPLPSPLIQRQQLILKANLKAVYHISAAITVNLRDQPRVNPGATQGRPGVNLGSTWGQYDGVNLGSSCTARPWPAQPWWRRGRSGAERWAGAPPGLVAPPLSAGASTLGCSTADEMDSELTPQLSCERSPSTADEMDSGVDSELKFAHPMSRA
jgi:hypothetical protein